VNITDRLTTVETRLAAAEKKLEELSMRIDLSVGVTSLAVLQRLGVSVPAAPYLTPLNPIVVFDGDSTDVENSTNHVGLFRAAHSYPGITIIDQAVGSAGLGNSSQRAAGTANSLWGRLNAMIAQNPTIAVVHAGTNDMPNDNSSGQVDAWLASYYGYIAALRAALPSVKIVVLPVYPYGTAISTYATFNPMRRTYTNPALLASVGGVGPDAFVDIAGTFLDADSTANDTTYFNADGQHPLGPYHSLLTQLTFPAIDQFLGGVAGGTALAPVLTKTSTTGVNPMTWTTVYAGMALDSDYIAMRWRENGGAWTNETEHLFSTADWLDNIDGTLAIPWPLYAAHTFAPGTVVDVQEGVHRGTDAIVWSTAITDTMVNAATITQAGTFNSDDLAAEGYPTTLTKTFTVTAGRPGFAVNAEQAATSATWNGVAMTKLGNQGTAPNSSPASVWLLPSNVSAGSGTLAITFAAAIGKVALTVFSGANLGTVSDTKIVNESTSPAQPATNLSFPSDGIGYAFAFGLYAASFTWTGATKISDILFNNTSGSNASSAAKVTIASRPIATQSAGYSNMIAIGFNHS
jgi:hypothetical protein